MSIKENVRYLPNFKFHGIFEKFQAIPFFKKSNFCFFHVIIHEWRFHGIFEKFKALKNRYYPITILKPPSNCTLKE